MTDKLEQIKKILASHFGLTDECPDGTYLYQLNRVKSAFHVGTITLDDFVEVDDEFLNEVFKAIKPVVEDLVAEVERLRGAIIEAIADIETISPHEAKKTLRDALNNNENESEGV